MTLPSKQSTKADIRLTSLKNCLVNLPQSLVDTLATTNAPAQDVVVEILTKDGAISKKDEKPVQRSIYVGWSGMPSVTRPAPLASRGREQGFVKASADKATVDIDATFGRMLGLTEGQQVGLFMHLDPPLAHTVNIEPLTPGDWEVIELHANFLELNLLSQIRALPNPSSSSSDSTQMQHSHPLTLHLSPTSTANIIVTSLLPHLSSSQPFAKIAADAEVIVAPKVRPRLTERNGSRSVASMGRKSASRRSGRSSGQRAETSEHKSSPRNLFLRPSDRRYCDELFDAENDAALENAGLRIWVDPDVIAGSAWSNVIYVSVSLVKPAGIEEVLDPHRQQTQKDTEFGHAAKPAPSVVAKLIPWHSAPVLSHAALSSLLCSSLNAPCIVGGIVHVQPASRPISNRAIQGIVIHRFLFNSAQKHESIGSGGQSQPGRDEASRILRRIFTHSGLQDSYIGEPLTNGLLIPPLEHEHSQSLWRGGILRFTYGSCINEELEQTSTVWVDGLDSNMPVEFEGEMISPFPAPSHSCLPDQALPMIGVESLIDHLSSQLLHSSSSLLTGGLGSGKTSLAKIIGCQLRARRQVHVSYLSCRNLTVDEVRISTVQESIERLFSRASWAVRLGGQSLVILDDLDKLCPVITELQTQDNSRSNQISERFCHQTRIYCGRTSGVTLLVTAQSQDSLNNLLVGANLFKDIVALKAPDKDRRRKLLQHMLGAINAQEKIPNGVSEQAPEEDSADQAGWIDGSLPPSPTLFSKDGLLTDRHLELFDVVRQTDGYMPADLALLVSRAKSEALIRSVVSGHMDSPNSDTLISNQDFDRALGGFSPASLRNVTLQSSNTAFDSIGGLKSIRNTLLETLQYPTLYAPIFANCPLRLRSGLLLYGYPGCGKTLLASAVAGECGLNFISVKGPEILNKYIGASEKSVRDLFERAESARPCVLFFDEFDSIAPKRGHDSTGVTDRVVNQLLTQMDGAEGLSGVYVLAATSRPDLIDPALLRPGRLDKSILCDLPNLDDRFDILTVISKKLKMDPEVLCSKQQGLFEVARRTEGYSGADLQAVIYNSHLEAIHDELRGHDGDSGVSKTMKGAKDEPSARFDILRFRFGKEADSEAGSTSVDGAGDITEYHAVIAKLERLRRVRLKRRQGLKQLLQRAEDDAQSRGRGDKGKQEVVIQWKHIEASLTSTRSSISPQERERLGRFYREFVVGRNGELPTGEGSTEVGGRASLM
ncbi:MAG: hypothetical protein LQ338_001290 [Usnochroma carphineum]|nr:MAG: hypothetical protein LQ338_001290 [Usnochroma carphineum]